MLDALHASMRHWYSLVGAGSEGSSDSPPHQVQRLTIT